MTSVSPPQTLKNLKQHSEYYHPGGDLTVIVGDTCFRVASVFFTRESAVFRGRFQEGTPKTGDEKSQSSQKSSNASEVCVKQTIVIESHENVTADDFALFCSIFFNRKFSIYEKTLDEWETILRLATQWQFEEVKQLAFREIDRREKFSMALVDRIVLYQKYTSPQEYIEPLFEELLTRSTSLFEEEGKALGLKYTIAVQTARENLIRTFGTKLEAQPLAANVKESVLQAVGELLKCLSSAPASEKQNPRINTDAKDGSGNRGGKKK